MSSVPPDNSADPAGRPVPKQAGLIAMILFLAALTMLFLAAIGGYVVIRLNRPEQFALVPISLPLGFWFSSFAIIAASIAIEMACGSLRRERQRGFRTALVVSLLLTLAFVFIQGPSLWILLQRHWTMSTPEGPATLYGLVFVIILLHAAHVLGGLVAMTVTTAHAFRDRYDHEHWQPVRYTAMYGHFLVVVWIVTFATFLVLH